MSTTQKQPREHSVPCQGCGYRLENGKPTVVVRTWNVSGFCDECETRGVPESRAAKQVINRNNAKRRHQAR